MLMIYDNHNDFNEYSLYYRICDIKVISHINYMIQCVMISDRLS